MGEVVYIPENLSEFQIPGKIIRSAFYTVFYKTITSCDDFQIRTHNYINSCTGCDSEEYSCFDNNISHNNHNISSQNPSCISIVGAHC